MELTQAFSVHWLTAIEAPLANKFYRQHGFRGKAKRHETCAVVRDNNREIIACAYLRSYYLKEDGLSERDVFTLLAGVAVAPEHQGQGVSRLLIKKLATCFDDTTYTFPYEHLLPFYESIGFRRVDSALQISSVNGVYQRYRSQGRAIVLMVHS